MDIWKLHKHPDWINHHARRLTIPKFAFKALKSSLLRNKEIMDAEHAISVDATYSYLYALNRKRTRFKLGELAISKSYKYSYWYADKILNRRFELGEVAIAEDAMYSWWYARNILKGKFELGENVISKSHFADDYVEFIKKK